jgi:hypothetical protein
MRGIVDGLAGLGLGKVGESDLAADAGLLLIPVSESSLTGDRLLRMERRRKKRSKSESGECVKFCEA